MKQAVFSERTLIPVSLVVTFLCLAVWIGNVSARADENQRALDLERTDRSRIEAVLATQLDTVRQAASEIKADVAGVDAKLDILLERRGLRR